MKGFVKVFLVLLFALYPFFIYAGLEYSSVRNVALLVLVFVIIRFSLLGGKSVLSDSLIQPIIFLAAIIIVVGSGAWLEDERLIRMYPVVTNVAFLFIFAFSLWNPPSIIERFARLREPNLPEEAVAYTKKVTQVWCVFFVVNGGVALYTVLYCSREVWTVYNGFISYMLMGLLFAIELLVRHIKKRCHE